jgi:hypothetical protein
MIAPPRTAELLLESLGADRALSDAVLGDMAEEFAQRVAYDGPHAARRWYWRESLSTMPHLLRAWRRDVGARGVAHLAGVIVTSYVLMSVATLLLSAPALVVLGWVGLTPIELLQLRGTPTFLAANTLLGAVITVLGGSLAASLHDRAPIVSALALGVAVAIANVTVGAFSDVAAAAPLWLRVVTPLMLIAGSVAGGVLHVRARARAVPSPT